MANFNPDDYVPVAERLIKYWEDHPKGRVETEMVFHDADAVIFQARVYRGDCVMPSDERPFGIGHAEEIRGEGFVNKTSHIENCETSALGRALANAGYEIKNGIASREEMQKVQRMTTKKTTTQEIRADEEKQVKEMDWSRKPKESPAGADGEKSSKSGGDDWAEKRNEAAFDGGKYPGMAWKDIPIEHIEKLAKHHISARKEQDYRKTIEPVAKETSAEGVNALRKKVTSLLSKDLLEIDLDKLDNACRRLFEDKPSFAGLNEARLKQLLTNPVMFNGLVDKYNR